MELIDTPYPSSALYPSSTLYPNIIPDYQVRWGAAERRLYHTGIDRGVLYFDGFAVPWDGITEVEESGNGSSTVHYIDGRIYMIDVIPSDYEGSMTVLNFPDEFAECLGVPQVAEGLFLDNQKPKMFGLSYRSLVGSGATGDLFGYQIHLIYQAFATLRQKSRRTIGDRPEPMELAFDIKASPVEIPGFRPTAHFIIDTRYLTEETVVELENILYGTGPTMGQLPDPVELYDMMNFGNAIEVEHQASTGKITIRGSGTNVKMTSTDKYQVTNINSTDNGDGTYTISDGGDTTVILT